MGEEEDAAGAGDTAAAADEGADAGGEDAPAADAGGDGGDAGADAGADAGGDDAGGDDAGGDDGGDAGDDGGDDGGAADEPVTAEDLANNDLDANDIDDDVKAQKYANRMAAKAGIKSRLKMYKLCNMLEGAAAELLTYALNNPMEKETVLSRRTELLQALYYLRHVSDVDDDFQQEEFEAEMKTIKVFRSKMGRLAGKETEFKDSDAEESSDDELDDGDDMEVLKESRKLMEFAFGKEMKP